MIRLVALLLLFALPARAESVVAGLGNDTIGITASFNGSQVLIYGAVRRDAPEPPGPMGIIVTLQGPSTPVTIRRKSRELGIWVNTAKVKVAAAPSFYAIATTAPLNDILDPDVDLSHRISIPLAVRAFAGPLEVDDTRPFTEALLRIRAEEGTFSLDTGAVTLVDNTLFRADFNLPANLIEGDYRARIFLMREGKVVDSAQAPIRVRRIGLERWLYTLSREQSALYGAMSLALAVFAGWAAAAAFRLIRR